MNLTYSDRTSALIDERDAQLNGHNSLIPHFPQVRRKAIWPKDLSPEALDGLAGEVVNTILPHSEGDQAAILLNFLVAFSSAIGKNPHFLVSGSPNCLNIFGVLVGDTATARKGTSWSTVRQVFKAHSQSWLKENVQSGLASGEGLIWRVRDPIHKQNSIKDKGKIVGYEDEIIDQGVSDKRLLAVESEFSRVLKMTSREGNILSITVREAFDSGDLSLMTKNNPAKATGAHISILGHITKAELLRNIGETELVNGFANRFIWMAVKNSKSLPEGGNLELSRIEHLAERLSETVTFAQNVGEMKRNDEAKSIWAKVYEPLGKERPGMMGAVLSRAQAIVARLSYLYALMDHSVVATPKHLKSALAVWERAEDSARYIFGLQMGNPVGDTILRTLELRGEMDQTEINDVFKGHKSADRIALALEELYASNLITVRKENTSGRPRIIWTLLSSDEDAEKAKKAEHGA